LHCESIESRDARPRCVQITGKQVRHELDCLPLTFCERNAPFAVGCMRHETRVATRQPLNGIAGRPAWGDAYCRCIARRVGVYRKDCEQLTPKTSRLQPRLREQSRRPRMVLEQRQMRRDVFRAPKPWPFLPGQIERANPERTGDGAHEHRAIARKPGQPPRVERLLRARSSPLFNFWELYI